MTSLGDRGKKGRQIHNLTTEWTKNVHTKYTQSKSTHKVHALTHTKYAHTHTQSTRTRTHKVHAHAHTKYMHTQITYTRTHKVLAHAHTKYMHAHTKYTHAHTKYTHTRTQKIIIEFVIQKCVQVTHFTYLGHSVVELLSWCPFYPVPQRRHELGQKNIFLSNEP